MTQFIEHSLGGGYDRNCWYYKKRIHSCFSDFEDSLQYVSALTIDGIDLIITRNSKDFRYSDLAVMTPDSFLKILNRKE